MSLISGRGIYFTDNPKNEHARTFPAVNDDDKRVMFFAKVLLGNVKTYDRHKINLTSAPDTYHSVHGTFQQLQNSDEYVVYRYGQALPYVKITYKA